jgi:hypothetical protein
MEDFSHDYVITNPEYSNIYTMSYIFDSDKIINNNEILNNININKTILNYNEIIELIKIHFSPTNMIKYFGNMRNLNGKQTRDLYKYMLDYFLNLFVNKMQEKMKLNVMNVNNDNDPYVCFIAECMNMIRASIKKYVRLRTSRSQPFWCKRPYLEKRNHEKYDCPINIKEFEYCPSFTILKKRGKTCKQIIKSSRNTNDMYTLMSDLCVSPVWNPKTVNKRKHIFLSQPIKKRHTRKIKHNNIINLQHNNIRNVQHNNINISNNRI